MTDREIPKPKSVAEREARLAEALRQNLKRRKEQVRGRSAEPPAPRAKPDGDAEK